MDSFWSQERPEACQDDPKVQMKPSAEQMRRQKLARRALQAPRRANPEEFAHDDPQIMAGDLNQVALGHLQQSPEPTPPPAAGLAHVREAAFHPFAPPAL